MVKRSRERESHAGHMMKTFLSINQSNLYSGLNCKANSQENQKCCKHIYINFQQLFNIYSSTKYAQFVIF